MNELVAGLSIAVTVSGAIAGAAWYIGRKLGGLCERVAALERQVRALAQALGIHEGVLDLAAPRGGDTAGG